MSENSKLSEKLRELGADEFAKLYLQLSSSRKFAFIDDIAREMDVEGDELKRWVVDNQELLNKTVQEKDWQNFNAGEKK